MACFYLNLTKDDINYGENLPVLSLDKVLKPLSLAPILSSTGPLEQWWCSRLENRCTKLKAITFLEFPKLICIKTSAPIISILFQFIQKTFCLFIYYFLFKIHCPISFFHFSSICCPPKLYLDFFYNSQKLKSSKFVRLIFHA